MRTIGARRPPTRAVVAGTLAVAAILATPAWAVSTLYVGDVKEQHAASVEFKLADQGAKRVHDFRIEHVRLRCQLGPGHILITHVNFHRIRVENDRFHKSKHPFDVAVAVRGQLGEDGRAHGRLRITEDAAFCDSGILHWHAHS
jgi:hypothetical protein